MPNTPKPVQSQSAAPLMLGISGMRGIVGASLTHVEAERYAFAFGSWLKDRLGGSPAVVLGADGRQGFEAILNAARCGLGGSGCVVRDLGIAATPSVGVATDEIGAAGAMIVTASHNPQEWNGLKCLVRAPGAPAQQVSARAPAANEANQIIEQYIAERMTGRAASQGGSPEAPAGFDAHALHVQRIRALLPASNMGEMSVLLDSCGASGAYAGALLLISTPGLRLTHINPRTDGVFPHVPEPTEENLSDIARRAHESGAAVTFAQDPDADRLAVIDETGRYIGEEYTLVLCTLAAIRAGLPADPVAVTNLSTSRMLDDLCSSHGIRVVRTPVGEANVVAAIEHERGRGSSVVMGGEGNGGVIWPKVTYVRDSIAGMALILDLLARDGRPLSRIVDEEFTRYSIIKRKIPIARKEDAAPHVGRIARAYSAARVDLQDGVRVDFDDRRAWFHVRASNTEPIMRIIAEATSISEADAMADRVMELVAGS